MPVSPFVMLYVLFLLLKADCIFYKQKRFLLTHYEVSGI